MAGPFYFAWAGGTIHEPITRATTGHTHGGVVETASIVGDVQAGSSLLTNMASNAGIAEGTLYVIEGPGLESGTFFMIEPALQAGSDSLNLTLPASASLRGVTFKITKAAPVDVGIATFAAGSNVVALDPTLVLAPGYYGATSVVIGQVNTGTGEDVQVGSAYLFYDGSSAAMYSLAALPGNTDAGRFECIAVDGGEFPLELGGLPNDDWRNVTAIPEADLAALTPGLVYNIAGNGITNGSTFVAPSSGTEITMSIPASSSGLAILTISGPRTPNAPFDAAVHNRFDEDIIDIEIVHEEGNFATLKTTVKNPAVGLLSPGRNLWCWLSWDMAWTPLGGATPSLVPLFNGRLVGVPRLAESELVELEFIARPDDFIIQKMALTDELSELPWYDPIWVAQNQNEDTVLESYSALWHIDRVSLALSVSDVIQGEDGIVEITEDQGLYDGFSLSYGSPPLTSVAVSGTVNWAQQADGLLDVTGPIVKAFSLAGSPLGNRPFPTTPATTANRSLGSGSGINGGGALISILNGDGLFTDWPKPGTDIGGGWALSTENDAGGTPLCFIHDATYLQGEMTYNVDFYGRTSPATKGTTTEETNVNVFLNTNGVGMLSAAFPVTNFKIRMYLQYKADRRRTETVNAVVTAGVQRVISDSADSDQETVTLTSDFVSQGIDPGGEIPIGSLGYKSYFQTERGAASFEYLLLVARAKLRARARAADLTFSLNWTDALGLGIGLRKSVRLFDRRLPGGVATGKVKSYKLLVADGVMRGEFALGCTVGNGDPANPAVGENSYVEDGYVSDYQVVAGGQVEMLPAELSYQPLTEFFVSDDGLNVTNLSVENAVNSCTVVNGLTKQIDTASAFQSLEVNGQLPTDAMGELVTTVTLSMKPVNGSEFHTDFFPGVSHLALPKTIDLGAEEG